MDATLMPVPEITGEPADPNGCVVRWIQNLPVVSRSLTRTILYSSICRGISRPRHSLKLSFVE